MKKADGYVIKKLEDEYVILPYGKRTEEVNEVITLSETAGFIYEKADQAENIAQLVQLVGKEYGVEASAVMEKCSVPLKTSVILKKMPERTICVLLMGMLYSERQFRSLHMQRTDLRYYQIMSMKAKDMSEVHRLEII